MTDKYHRNSLKYSVEFSWGYKGKILANKVFKQGIVASDDHSGLPRNLPDVLMFCGMILPVEATLAIGTLYSP